MPSSRKGSESSHTSGQSSSARIARGQLSTNSSSQASRTRSVVMPPLYASKRAPREAFAGTIVDPDRPRVDLLLAQEAEVAAVAAVAAEVAHHEDLPLGH